MLFDSSLLYSFHCAFASLRPATQLAPVGPIRHSCRGPFQRHAETNEQPDRDMSSASGFLEELPACTCQFLDGDNSAQIGHGVVAWMLPCVERSCLKKVICSLPLFLH